MKNRITRSVSTLLASSIALLCCHTMWAQSPTLSVDKTQLTFCIPQQGSAPVVQTVGISATGGDVNFTVTPSVNWLFISPTLSNTSVTSFLSVSVNPFTIPFGSTQFASMQIAGPNNSVTVSITVNFGAGCGSTAPFTASPSSIALTVDSSTPATVTRTVNLSGTAAAVSASTSISNGCCGWLTVSPNAGNVPGSFTVSINASALSGTPGTYIGSVTFTQQDNPAVAVTVPVTVTVPGAGGFNASPAILNFGFSAGATATQSQNLVVSGTNVALNATVSTVNGGTTWLGVSPLSAAGTPATFSVSVNPVGLGVGTYSGSVTISQQSNPSITFSVPVNVVVNAGGGGSFVASPTSLNYVFPLGTITQQTQAVSISGPGSTATLTLSGNSVGLAQVAWFTVQGVTPGSTILLPTTLSVTVDTSALSGTPGTYSGSIILTQSLGNVLTIPVNVTIGTGGTSFLSPVPSQLQFAYQIGVSSPPAQTLNITGPANATFTAQPSTTACGNWLSVFPQSGFTNSLGGAQLTVQVNTSTIGIASTCSGQIAVSVAGASNTVTVPVSVLASSSPVLVLGASGASFAFQPGGALPANQAVQVNASSGTLAFSAAANLTTPNFLFVSQTSTTTPSSIVLSLNPAVVGALAAGTYMQNVLVSSFGLPTQTFPVSLVVGGGGVNATASLVSNASSLTLNDQVTQAAPSQSFTISTRGAPVSFTASASLGGTCANFVTVSPSTATVQAGSPATLTLSVTSAVTPSVVGSTPVTCTGSITITPANFAVPSLTLPLTLNLSQGPLISPDRSSINVTLPAGESTGVNIALTSTDSSTPLNYSISLSTTTAGQIWLAASPLGGTTPSTVLVQLNPVLMPPGVYTGSIVISSSTPNVPSQTIPVTLTVTGQATVTPASLSFTQQANGPLPASQTIQVGGIPSATPISATVSTVNGLGWLSAAVSGTSVIVSINNVGLSAGSYTGNVAVNVPGNVNGVINVAVTLTVSNSQVLTLSAGTVSFSFVTGSAAPQSQTVQVTGTGGASVPFTVRMTGSNFLTVSSSSATTPATLTLGVNSQVLTGLGTGTHNASVLLTPTNGGPSQTINVTLSVTAPPTGPQTISSVVNAATQQAGAVAPGEVVSIYGSGIGPASGVAINGSDVAGGSLPVTLSDTKVTFDEIPAPLIYVRADQVNAIVPYEVSGRSNVSVRVIRSGLASVAFQVKVTDTAPGIFTLSQGGAGQAAVLNQDGSVNGPSSPARKGTAIAIFGTGEGVYIGGLATGSIISTTLARFPTPVAPVYVTIGGIPSTVLYKGPAPGLAAGILQVNVMVPQSTGSGPQAIVLGAGSNTSPAAGVTVYVQ